MREPIVDLPERMNAAVDFVDANVAAGWGERLAIINADDGSSYTYNDVLVHTNRAGNALTQLGVRREERVMLLLLDSPEFVFNFFGCHQDRRRPDPDQHAAQTGRLRIHDQRQPDPGARGE